MTASIKNFQCIRYVDPKKLSTTGDSVICEQGVYLTLYGTTIIHFNSCCHSKWGWHTCSVKFRSSSKWLTRSDAYFNKSLQTLID